MEILEKYKDNIDYLVSEPDSGIYSAMNKGINNTTGDYIVFMNAGDTFYDGDTLCKVSKYFGADLIYGKSVKHYGEYKSITSYPKFIDKDYLSNYTLSHQSSYYRKNVFDEYGMYDETYKIAGDYEFYARLINQQNFTSKYIDEPLSVFYLDGISNKVSSRDRLKFEQHKLRLKHFENYKKSYKFYKYIIRFIYKIILFKTGIQKVNPDFGCSD